MANQYDALAKTIVENVGGPENVLGLTHCVTRLRFSLKDTSKANTKAITDAKGVIKVLEAGGQYQVVVGNKVEALFDCIQDAYHFGEEGACADKAEKKGAVNALMSTISAILAPTLGVLTAAGITKGLVSLAATLGWCSTTSGLYMVLYALGDGFFYFLPVLLGFTAAKQFKCNTFVGAGIGAALVYPAMVNIGTTLEVTGTIFANTPFAMSYYNTFLGIPIIMPGTGYTSSIIPIILAVFVASKIEAFCKAHIVEVLRGVLTPLITLVLGTVLTYLVIGPVSMAICGCIATFVNFLYSIPVVGGIVAGALVGGGFGILVMFGLHWVLISLGLSTIAINGFDYMMACGSIGPMIGMFQGIAICIAARKNRKVRDLAVPSTISQICGVGEPLMYSILIPLKKPLVLNILGGCIGGAVIGLLQTKMYAFGASGLFSFANFVSASSGMTDLIKYSIGVLVGGIFVFVAQLLTYKEEEADALL